MERGRQPWAPITLELLSVTESVLSGMRRFGAWVLDRALLYVHAQRVSHDPASAEWVAEIDRRAADGTLYADRVDRDELQRRIAESRKALG